MAAYLVARIHIDDPEGFRAYQEVVPEIIARHGGRYLVRGGATQTLEGEDDGRRLVILEFPSAEAVKAFWSSPDYEDVKALRRGASTADIIAVEGVEGAGG